MSTTTECVRLDVAGDVDGLVRDRVRAVVRAVRRGRDQHRGAVLGRAVVDAVERVADARAAVGRGEGDGDVARREAGRDAGRGRRRRRVVDAPGGDDARGADVAGRVGDDRADVVQAVGAAGGVPAGADRLPRRAAVGRDLVARRDDAGGVRARVVRAGRVGREQHRAAEVRARIDDLDDRRRVVDEAVRHQGRRRLVARDVVGDRAEVVVAVGERRRVERRGVRRRRRGADGRPRVRAGRGDLEVDVVDAGAGLVLRVERIRGGAGQVDGARAGTGPGRPATSPEACCRSSRSRPSPTSSCCRRSRSRAPASGRCRRSRRWCPRPPGSRSSPT